MFWENFFDLCKKQNKKPSPVAQELGFSSAAVTKWKKGTLPSTTALYKIADYFNVTVDYLLGNTDTTTSTIDLSQYPNIRPVTLKKFPMLGSISCGKPIFAIEDKESFINADSEIDADFCLTCKGDSMIGANIHDGDIIFIKTQTMVDNGEIAAIIIENEATLKRIEYHQEANLLMLHAENPAYKTLIFRDTELDQIRILGKAVALLRKVK